MLPPSFRYAKNNCVHRSTFDSEEELKKTVEIDPKAELVLRIKADDEEALLVLGTKFGATLPEAYHLLDVASDMNAKVIGVRSVVVSTCNVHNFILFGMHMMHASVSSNFD